MDQDFALNANDEDLIILQENTVDRLNGNCLNKDKKEFDEWEKWDLQPSNIEWIPDTIWSLNKCDCYYENDGYGSAEVFDRCSSCEQILNEYISSYNNLYEEKKYKMSKIGQLERKISSLENHTIKELQNRISELENQIKVLKGQ